MLKNTSPERKRSWIWSCWCESDVAASYAERGEDPEETEVGRKEERREESQTSWKSIDWRNTRIIKQNDEEIKVQICYMH